MLKIILLTTSPTSVGNSYNIGNSKVVVGTSASSGKRNKNLSTAKNITKLAKSKKPVFIKSFNGSTKMGFFYSGSLDNQIIFKSEIGQ